MDLYGIETFTIDQVSEKIIPLNEQRKNLTDELESLNATTGEIDEAKTYELAKAFSEVLEREDINEIRLTIESLIYYIEIDNDDVLIHWKTA